MVVKMLICLILTCWACQALQFHLQVSYQLPASSVANISALSDDKIVVAMYDQGMIKTVVLNGTNFTNLVSQNYQFSNYARAKFTEGKRFQNFYTYIEEEEQTKIYNVYSLQQKLTLSESALITQRFTLFSENNVCPQIKRVNLTSTTVDTFFLEPEENCSISGVGNFSHLKKDGVIIYGTGSLIYILDQETLEVKSRITFKNSSGSLMKVSSMSEVYDYTVKASFIQIGSQTDFIKYRYDPSTHQLIPITQFYNPTYYMALMDSSRSVSFRFRQYTKTMFCFWQDYQKIILALNFDDDSQFLIGKMYFALSFVEDIFVVTDQYIFVQDSQRTLSFYSIDEKYKIKLLYQLTYPQGFVGNSNDKKARFTNNDKFLIIVQWKGNSSILIKVDTDNRIYTSIYGNSTPIEIFLDFTLFDAKIDRLILLIKRYSSQNLNQYYLQLRKISDLSIITEKKIDISDLMNNPKKVKLVGNQMWVNLFSVYFDNNQQQNFYLYKIQNDQIMFAEKSLMQSQSYPNIFACNQYLVFISSTIMRVFKFDNFEVLLDENNQLRFSLFYAEKDILIIQGNAKQTYNNITDIYPTAIFDFSKQKSEWNRGIIYKKYQSSVIAPTPYNNIIFSKRKLFYYFRDQYNDQIPYKVVYNISRCPISNTRSLQVKSRILSQNTQSYKYLEYLNYSKQLKVNQSANCGYIFFIQTSTPPVLRRFDTCKESDNETSYELLSVDIGSTWAAKILKSSTEDRIIIMLKGYSSGATPFFHIEIRSMQNPNHIVYIYEAFTAIQGWPIYDINLDNCLLTVLKASQFKTVEIQELKRLQYSYSYQTKSFSTYCVNKAYLAMAGVSIKNSSTSNIIIKQLGSNFYFFKTNVQGNIFQLAFNDDMTVIAAYSSKSILFVWNISSKAIIYINQHLNVKEIKVLGMNKVLLAYSKSFQIINYTSIATQPTKIKLQYAADYSKIAINAKGQLIAYISDNNVVTVLTNDGLFVMNFSTSGSFVDLTFTPNNTLMIIEFAGNLFVLSPTPCPSTFFNFNGNCFCSKNATLVNKNMCQCKINFISDIKNTTCSCPQTLQFKNDQCNSCGQNFTLINRVCQCKENFQPSRSSCYCPSSFSALQGQCFCINGYIESNTCIKCSFLCENGCTASFLACQSFSTAFYLIIGGIAIVLIVIAIIIIYWILRKKMRSISSNVDDSNLSKDVLSKDDSLKKSLKSDASQV